MHKKNVGRAIQTHTGPSSSWSHVIAPLETGHFCDAALINFDNSIED